MLKKFYEASPVSARFSKGKKVYIVFKEGRIADDFTITSSLGELVSLDRSPLDGSEKQGFTIDGELLRPNWCLGKKHIVAGCLEQSVAQDLAATAQARYKKRNSQAEENHDLH